VGMVCGADGSGQSVARTFKRVNPQPTTHSPGWPFVACGHWLSAICIFRHEHCSLWKGAGVNSVKMGWMEFGLKTGEPH